MHWFRDRTNLSVRFTVWHQLILERNLPWPVAEEAAEGSLAALQQGATARRPAEAATAPVSRRGGGCGGVKEPTRWWRRRTGLGPRVAVEAPGAGGEGDIAAAAGMGS
jgi:hypothetical protein